MRAARGESRRILVVGPSWVGDMVMAQSLFKALVFSPDDKIDVLAPAGCLPLLARMPEVHASIESPFQHSRLQLRQRYRLGRGLSGRRYHQAIVLPNSWKSALVPYWAGIPLRTGYLGEQRWGLLNDIRALNKVGTVMTVRRFVDLAHDDRADSKDLIWPQLSSSPGKRACTARDLGVSLGNDPVLVMCPGAEYGPAKCWPGEYFTKVAQTKINQSWQVWLVGSGKDMDIAADINHRCQDRCVDLTGKTNLEQVVDLLAAATCVVSNDSGLMHIAAAVGSPLVAIFGSTDPKHTPPLSTNCEVAYLGLECSPCFERQCPLEHLNCLKQLTPGRILDAMDQVLGRSS